MSDGFLQKETPAVETSPLATPPANSPESLPAEGDEGAAPVESTVFEQPDTFLEEAPVSVMPTTAGHADEGTEQVADAVSKEYVKDEVVIEVEEILEDGLGDFVQAMPNDVKLRFLQKGQEIAMILAGMVRDYKVKVKQVIHLIRDWLLTIPGVNKFFLEQEAKIKTDRILDLEKMRHDGLPATP